MKAAKERPVAERRNKYSRKLELYKDFRNFIIDNDHPCIMAQTVFKMEQLEIKDYEELGSAQTAKKLIKDLKSYIDGYDFESNDFRTFLAVFPDSPDYSEIEFEKLLWKQLKALSEEDDCDWDPEVSSDPESEHFSFSIGGKAFYIVGMHPGSSRMARQSPHPVLVFNLHWQFEKLREMGSYENVRDRIRQRDEELQGNINPMLEDFGQNSEARQYSGRAVSDNWKCPFHK